MKWILKPGQEAFQAMDGKMAGRKYEAGKVYTEIPEEEKHRFREWAKKKQASPEETTITQKTGAKTRKGQESKK